MRRPFSPRTSRVLRTNGRGRTGRGASRGAFSFVSCGVFLGVCVAANFSSWEPPRFWRLPPFLFPAPRPTSDTRLLFIFEGTPPQTKPSWDTPEVRILKTTKRPLLLTAAVVSCSLLSCGCHSSLIHSLGTFLGGQKHQAFSELFGTRFICEHVSKQAYCQKWLASSWFPFTPTPKTVTIGLPLTGSV